jgi:CRP-like cAMP-binding protein
VPRSAKLSPNQLARRLKKVSILRALPAGKLRSLAKWAEVTEFGRNRTIVRRGERGNGLFLILDGSVEVRRSGRRLARLGKGQFFGEMSLLDNLPRSADVVALSPSKLAVLSKLEFWGFAASEPTVVLSVLEEMSRRLRAANHLLTE